MKLIALITDFGLNDWFAGEMKGVMCGISAESVIVDITHCIPPGNIRSAAFTLLACYRSFPVGTVFCVTVDPGAGHSSKAIAAANERYSFVGPDNGVLSWALDKENVTRVYQLSNDSFFRKPVSSTFRGRDIFGPVSSHMSKGLHVEQLGPLLSTFVKLPFPQPEAGNTLLGEILFIDSFGNAITNIESDLVYHKNTPYMRIIKSGLELTCRTDYGQVEPQRGLFYFGSAGFVEIGVNGGNAAEMLNLAIGDKVEIS